MALFMGGHHDMSIIYSLCWEIESQPLINVCHYISNMWSNKYSQKISFQSLLIIIVIL